MKINNIILDNRNHCYRGIILDEIKNITDEFIYGDLIKYGKQSFIVTGINTKLDKKHYDLFDSYDVAMKEVSNDNVGIHYKDMLDMDGEPIFVSINESGNGGDILQFNDWKPKVAIYSDGKFSLKDTDLYIRAYELGEIKVVAYQINNEPIPKEIGVCLELEDR